MKLSPRLFRFCFNLYPPYLFTATRIDFIAPDWKKMVIRVRKSLLNRNYVGSIFGGTLFAATDPHLMLMLIRILGIENYIVWDQAASIHFKKPARSDVTFIFEVTDSQIADIIEQASQNSKIRPQFTILGVDQEGDVCCEVVKTVYIRKKT